VSIIQAVLAQPPGAAAAQALHLQGYKFIDCRVFMIAGYQSLSWLQRNSLHCRSFPLRSSLCSHDACNVPLLRLTSRQIVQPHFSCSRKSPRQDALQDKIGKNACSTCAAHLRVQVPNALLEFSYGVCFVELADRRVVDAGSLASTGCPLRLLASCRRSACHQRARVCPSAD